MLGPVGFFFIIIVASFGDIYHERDYSDFTSSEPAVALSCSEHTALPVRAQHRLSG